MKKRWNLSTLFLMVSLTVLGIGISAAMEKNMPVYVDSVKIEGAVLEDEIVPLSEGAAAVPVTVVVPAVEVVQAAQGAAVSQASAKNVQAQTVSVLAPQASGIQEKSGNQAVIDYSNTADGYVMVQYTQASEKRLKVQVKGPTTTYTYNLPAQQWNVFPLSDGNGTYQVSVFHNVADNRYAQLLSAGFAVELSDEFAPFIRPNQYVNYSAASAAVAVAAELTAGVTDPLKKVELVYDYVVGNLTYDKEKAATVTSGYLPVLDAVLAQQKGICFDYAALMTGMLRSQGIPCKLVVGYAGTVYHAWISVWTEETGWVDGVIYFDSESWHRMDPTFASSGKRSDAVMKYIGDGTNYTTKYLY